MQLAAYGAGATAVAVPASGEVIADAEEIESGLNNVSNATNGIKPVAARIFMIAKLLDHSFNFLVHNAYLESNYRTMEDMTDRNQNFTNVPVLSKGPILSELDQGSKPGTVHEGSARMNVVSSLKADGHVVRTQRDVFTSREVSTEHLCLNARAYADVIARTITKTATDDDFMFALYGAWGRGKTTVVKEVEKLFQDDDWKADTGITNIELVKFSAWKYPVRPEIWAHLYERLAETMEGGGWKQSWRVRYRICLLKKGWASLVMLLLLFAATGLWLPLAFYFMAAIGIGGLWIASTFGWSAWKLKKQLQEAYFSTPDHTEKLGLQAVIGDDLKRLLSACMGKARKVSFTLHWISVSLATSAFISAGWRFLESRKYELDTVGEWVIAGVCFLAGVAVLLIGCLLYFPPRECDKVVLIVDDLDRCDPDQMIAVVESTRLFLDDREMSSFMRVIMLMDQDIFRKALEVRWMEFFGQDNKPSFQDHFLAMREKYFIIELSLPLLSEEDIMKVADAILEHVAVSKETVTSDVSWRERIYSFVKGIISPKESLKALPPPASGKPMELFSSDEREYIRETIRGNFVRANDLMPLREGDPAAKVVTPRAIRAFLLRYQLARLLLQKTGKEFDPRGLAGGVAQALLSNGRHDRARYGKDILWATDHII